MFFLKIYKSVNQFKATANYSNLTQHWLRYGGRETDKCKFPIESCTYFSEY